MIPERMKRMPVILVACVIGGILVLIAESGKEDKKSTKIHIPEFPQEEEEVMKLRIKELQKSLSALQKQNKNPTKHSSTPKIDTVSTSKVSSAGVTETPRQSTKVPN